MSSTRSSSPMEGLSSSGRMLSPRSKLQALLNAPGGSDGDDSDNSTKSASHLPLPRKHAGRDESGSEEDEEEDEDDIRPVGRLASRMQKATAVTTASTERVRTAANRDAAAAHQSTNTSTQAMDDEDDDDEALVASRRLVQRQRAATPEPNAASPMSSPGLFVSPRHTPLKQNAPGRDSESDNAPTYKNDRFKALVERKRQERLAREAEEERKREERAARQEAARELFSDSEPDNVSDIEDDDGGRKLTQEATRPSRKASKRAMEEMHRETQRMARSMQLAHEARTRKKISKASLFEKFNFRPQGAPEPDSKATNSSRPVTPGSAGHTDAEMQSHETPPTSPPSQKKKSFPEPGAVGQATAVDDDDDLPPLDEIMGMATQKADKGKGKAVATAEESPVAKPKRNIRVRLPQVAVNAISLDSDDELQIVKGPKSKLEKVFESVPLKKNKDSRSLFALRALAQVKSPGKERRRKGEQPGMTPAEARELLAMRAKRQVQMERDRRIEMLRAQGIVVETAEERERQVQEVEDIVAKAREEAEEIMRREKESAKKEKKANGETDPLAWDDSEDEEYQAENEEAGEPSAIELSGSEEDSEEGEDGSDEEKGDGLVDDAAQESDSPETVEVESKDVDSDEDMIDLPVRAARRNPKTVTLVSDDEDEDFELTPLFGATPAPKTAAKGVLGLGTDSPAAPTSVMRSATKTFIPGLPVAGPAGLGLTQIFAGTMDDSQASVADGAPVPSVMSDFASFPDPNMSDNEGDQMVLDSQAPASQRDSQGVSQGIEFMFNQSQMHGLDSLLQEEPGTQMPDLMEATQDAGLGERTPLRNRFIEPPESTATTIFPSIGGETSTVANTETPVARKGRLIRKADVRAPSEQPTQVPESPEKDEFGFGTTSISAFDKLNKGARKAKKLQKLEDFNRKKSKAKDMFEEQAEESEDEYAGLGGADGEDSSDDDVASVKEMIDDEGGKDVDEGKLAAFYADRERANDEKQVEKLFRDITNGMLRRKRGADYDLSDSDDGGEARRRMKRRQFAKMQKALFADERIKKFAERPGNQAFLRTIEDRNSDEEDMSMIDFAEETSQTEDSQSQPQQQDKATTIPDSQPGGNQPLAGVAANRAPANARRTKNGKKPSNIGEIRDSLSSLLDEPHQSVVPATEVGSDSDADADDEDARAAGYSSVQKENRSPPSASRNRRRGREAVIDRISLKRASSSNVSTGSTASATGRLAFAAPSIASKSFKVPQLLRRATANSMASNSETSSVGAKAGAFGDDVGKIKRAAGKKSGVSNLVARESERNATVGGRDRKREERKWKGAEKRSQAVGGLFGSGTFE